MLSLALNRDSILALAGIGPKAMQTIEAAVSAVTYPEPEPEPEPEVVAVEAEEAILPVSEAAGEAQPAVEAGEPAAEGAKEPVEGEAEEAVSEKDFEKIFSMQNVTEVAPSDEEAEKAAKKKGKKTVGKSLEFDEERGEVVARKKHKRGEEGWTTTDW
jgi:hypothetical protein